MDSDLLDFLKDGTGLKVASRRRTESDEDLSDRLNHKVTPMILVVFAIMISAKQYVVGKPLQCWVPAEFSDEWEAYAENYCWVQNTYFVPPGDSLPKTQSLRRDGELGYYQWVPFVLALQALTFLVPKFVWLSLRNSSGLDIKSFVKMAMEATAADPKSRDASVQMVARHIKASLQSDWDSVRPDADSAAADRAEAVGGRARLGVLSFVHGVFVSSLYIFVKLLYVGNVVGQFFLLQAFLGTDYLFYGVQILRDLAAGRDWQTSGHFPRVTMCDFEVRALGQPRRYSLQCVLVINLFNEKIYIFLWFWLAFVGVLTVASLATWLVWMLLPGWRQETVYKCLRRREHFRSALEPPPSGGDDREHLLASGRDERQERREEELRKALVEDVLRSDGLFMLRMVGANAGEPVVFDIVNALWMDVTGEKPLDQEPQKAPDPAAQQAPAATPTEDDDDDPKKARGKEDPREEDPDPDSRDSHDEADDRM